MPRSGRQNRTFHGRNTYVHLQQQEQTYIPKEKRKGPHVLTESRFKKKKGATFDYVQKDIYKEAKSNLVRNEVKEFRIWLQAKQEREGIAPKVRYKKDHSITTLHRKGSWINPNKISILNQPKSRVIVNQEWLNRETLSASDQQRVSLQRLLMNPNQEIRFRTQKHALKETQLHTPRVFRNEGGNLMSSIAGAGCNKFHEFRQIRRNDRDREKFFTFLREKEDRENKQQIQVMKFKNEQIIRLARNRKNRKRVNAKMVCKKEKWKNDKILKLELEENEIKEVKEEKEEEEEKEEKEEIIDEQKQGNSKPINEENCSEVSEYDEENDEGMPPKELRLKVIAKRQKRLKM